MTTPANITNVTTTAAPSSTLTNATFVISNETLIFNAVGSVLSVLGAIFMYWSYAFVPEVRNITRKLLLFLTTADLFTAVGYIIGVFHYVIVVKVRDISRDASPSNDDPDDTDAICIIQSFITIFSNLAAYFWTMTIAAHIAVAVVFGNTTRGSLCNVLFHVVSWGIPAVISITAAGYGVLGQDNVVRPLPWCFLRNQENHQKFVFWTIMASIGWELLTYMVTALLYMYTKYSLHLRKRLHLQQVGQDYERQAANSEERQQTTRDDRNFLFVWLILYVLKLWGTVRLFIITAHPDAYTDPHYKKVMTVLLTLQSFFTSGQAFLNSVIFCFCDRAVRNKVAGLCCRKEGERAPLLLVNSDSDVE